MVTAAEQLGTAVLRLPELVEELERLAARVAALEARLPHEGPTPPFNQRLRFNTKQAAEYTGRHAVTLRRAAALGDLHGSQLVAGGHWSFERECLDAWLTSRPCPHSQEGAALPS